MNDRDLYSAVGRVWGPAHYTAPLLRDIAAQAAEADQSRSVSAALIARIKHNDVMRLSGSPEIGGLNERVLTIANELRAVAARCTSTAWCLWNHLCTFHHFAGLLGPSRRDFLSHIVRSHEWVCFPAGASSDVAATIDGDIAQLSGVAAFGSGAR